MKITQNFKHSLPERSISFALTIAEGSSRSAPKSLSIRPLKAKLDFLKAEGPRTLRAFSTSERMMASLQVRLRPRNRTVLEVILKYACSQGRTECVRVRRYGAYDFTAAHNLRVR